ncbi:hypothetical protein CK203_110622 [Vitis vinifera]|uniref:Retrotransposon gag domain-containing protein n=1 Tax=Vitis vinifera TaxID=29760 RepID=A0A438CB44_VITVI|nr:hypothetical protein CK203_110622 [Vitis vinifera]
MRIKDNGLKRQISNFSAKENEKFYECWERYMEAINACPHHGFDTWLLVSYFYDGTDTKANLQLWQEEDWRNLKCRPFQTHQCKLSRVQFVNLLSTCPIIMVHIATPTIQIGGTIPNFSWKPRAPQYTQPGQALSPASNLEQVILNLNKVVGDFVADQKSINDQFMQEMANRDRRIDGKHNDLSQKIDKSPVPDLKAY